MLIFRGRLERNDDCETRGDHDYRRVEKISLSQSRNNSSGQFAEKSESSSLGYRFSSPPGYTCTELIDFVPPPGQVRYPGASILININHYQRVSRKRESASVWISEKLGGYLSASSPPNRFSRFLWYLSLEANFSFSRIKARRI